MSHLSIRGTFSHTVLALFAVSSYAVTAEANPKIPEARVMTTYTVPTIDENGEALAAGSGVGRQFSIDDLARLDATTRNYPSTVRDLERILSEIRRRSPDLSVNPKIKISNIPKASAYAINQDLIVVSVGLLQALAGEAPHGQILDEDEDLKFDLDPEEQTNALAYILAHEYAHLLYRHPQVYAKKQKDTKIFTDMVAAGFAAVQIANQVNATVDVGLSDEIQEANEALMIGAVASPWVEAELYRFAYAPFTKESEQLADYMAIDLLSDVKNTDTVFQARKGAQPLRGLYKDYDDSLEGKVKALGKEASKSMEAASERILSAAPATLFNGGNMGGLVKDNLKLAFLDFGLKQLMGRLNKQKVHLYHRSSKRVDAIDEYYSIFYKEAEETADAGLMASFASLMDNFSRENTPTAAADQAMSFLLQGDLKGAKEALESVISGNKYSNTDFISASGHVAYAEGKFEEAVGHYSRAISNADVAMDVYSKLAHSYAFQDMEGPALQTLDKGMEVFGKDAFIIEKIQMLLRFDKPDEALALNGQCQASENKSVRKACEKSIEHLLAKEDNGPLGLGKIVDL